MCTAYYKLDVHIYLLHLLMLILTIKVLLYLGIVMVCT